MQSDATVTQTKPVRAQNPQDQTVKTFTAREAKTHFADVLRSAQTEPVTITKNGKPAMIAVSPEQFESLNGQRRQRFLENARAMRNTAQKRGLTETKLNEILAELDA